MIVEPAPSFGAAGSYLSAPYSIDFGKDLSHTIPIDGTWQGDRKSGKSIYIDNYANNISITVSSGNYSIRIPPYTSAYVDLTGFNDILLTADGSGTNSVSLSTEKKSTEMISRGNSPASNVAVPFTYAGTANLTTSTTAGMGANISGQNPGPVMIFCPLNNCMYIYSKNGNVIVFDCATNKIKTVFVPATGYIPYSAMFYNGKIYFGLNNGYIVVINPTDNSTSFKQIGVNGSYVISMCVHETEQYIYAICSPSNTYRIPISLAGTAQIVTDGVSTLINYGQLLYRKQNASIYCICFNSTNSGDITVGHKMSGGIVTKLNDILFTGSGTNTQYPQAINYDGDDVLYVAYTGGTSTFKIVNLKFSASGFYNAIGTLNSTNTFGIGISSTSGYVYIPDSFIVYDPLLKGVVGSMPGPLANYSVYCPTNDYMYFLCIDGYLKWGK